MSSTLNNDGEGKIKDLQTEKPILSFDEWKKELIRITSEQTGNQCKIKLNEEGAKEWWLDGFTPYATFRETFCPLAGYL